MPSRSFRLVATAAIVSAAGLLLLVRLGHYALWDDEANTALIGRGVWRTGDTTALVEGNLVAFGGGLELDGTKARYLPPLPYFLVAPFSGPAGATALTCRLPFALCGIAFFALACNWLWRAGAERLTWGLTGLGLLGNVSLLLYYRQCRYYAPAMLLSAVIVMLYWRWNGKRPRLAATALAAAGVGLLATNYLNYAALVAGLAVDFVIWGRRKFRPGRAGWALILVPQLLAGVALLSVWSPLGRSVPDPGALAGPSERLTLFWWYLRDLDRNEFGALAVLVAAPLVAFLRRDSVLKRASLGLAVFLLVVSAVSPQVLRTRDANEGTVRFATNAAEVRYAAPVIPLCVLIAVMLLSSMPRRLRWTALPFGALLFGTNLVHGGPLLPPDPGHANVRPRLPGLRSTFASYVRELADPPGDPYREAAAWVNANVNAGQTVWVVPRFAAFPLMFHAPRASYAWMLSDPPPRGLADIPEWMIVGRVPPDHVIAFGPARRHSDRLLPLLAARGARYRRAARLDIYYQDLYRPELLWRTFEPVAPEDPENESILIFSREESAATP